MHNPARTFLIFLGVCLAFGSPAFTIPAQADPDDPKVAVIDPDYRPRWGPFYSSNGRAYARGSVNVDRYRVYGNSAYVSGRIYDRDYRYVDEGGKCALVRFSVRGYDSDGGYHVAVIDPRFHPRSFRFCGADRNPNYRSFAFRVRDVAVVRVQVCQSGYYNHRVYNCGRWWTIYNGVYY